MRTRPSAPKQDHGRDVIRRLGLALLVAVAALARPSQADFTHRDDPYFGPRSIVRDDRTGLEWLHMGLSTLTPAQQADLEAGSGHWSRFRLATESELETLLRDAGLLPLSACSGLSSLCAMRYSRNVVDAVKITGFQSILGATHTVLSGELVETNGRLSNGSSFYVAANVNSVSYGCSLGCFVFNDCDPNASSPHPGNWIIRTSSALLPGDHPGRRWR